MQSNVNLTVAQWICHMILASQYHMKLPTVPTHHGIELVMGLATGLNHRIMAVLDEELQLISNTWCFLLV